jgi:hypothetical protein
MNAPVLASTKISALVAGDGHGWGVAVYGPHEKPANEPDRRTAQTRVSGATNDPPPASAPYVESVVAVTLTGPIELTLARATASAAADETVLRSAIDGGAADGAGRFTTRVGFTCRPTAKATNATIMDTIRIRGGKGKPRPAILGDNGTRFGRSSLTK